MNSEEKLVVSQIQTGNRKVFRSIYEKYYSDLVVFASSYLQTQDLSEDVVQNFFIHFWENRDTIKVSGSLKSYCFFAIKNRCLNRLRDYHLRDEKNLAYLDGLLKLDDDQLDQEVDLVNELEQAIHQLPDQMKRIFLKKYFEGLKTHEIASELEVSENTINTQLKRGKKKIKELLQGLGSLGLVFWQLS